MIAEEEKLYKQILSLKTGHDKLFVIMEELQDLIKMDYSGSFNSPEMHGLLCAFKEYKRWELEQLKQQQLELEYEE